MSTCIPCPASRCALHCSAANASAGLSRKRSLSQRSRMATAPAMSASTSMPSNAAGNVPTGESTENRPPTFGGMSKVGIPSALAMGRNTPFAGSVTNAIASFAAIPALRSRSRMNRYCDIVSAVLPDLEITRKRVRGRSTTSSSPRTERGSTLSSTCRRGRPPRSARDLAFQSRGSNAVRSATAPSADPPMPSTTTSSRLVAAVRAHACTRPRSAACASSSRKPSTSRAASARSPACAAARRGASAVRPAGVAPCGTARPSMPETSSWMVMTRGSPQSARRRRAGCQGEVPPRARRGPSRASGA